MPGLPFTSLDEQAKPDPNAGAFTKHEQFLDSLKGPGSRRSWIEPNWDALGRPATASATGAAGQSAPASLDPMEELVSGHKAAFDNSMAELTAQQANLQKTIEPDLRLLRQKAELDIQAVTQAALPIEEKQAKLKDLQLTAQKKELEIRSRVQGGLDELEQTRQALTAKSTFDLATRQHDIQFVQGLVNDGQLDPYEGRSLQYKIAGKNIPAAMFKPDKEQTARQELGELSPVVRTMTRGLNMYATPSASEGSWLFGKVRAQNLGKGPLQVLKEEYRIPANTGSPTDYTKNKTMFRDATPEEEDYYWSLRRQLPSALSREQELRGQILGRHVPSLSAGASQAANPVAQTVRGAGVSAATPKRTSDPLGLGL